MIKLYFLFGLASAETLKFYENREQNERLTFNSLSEIKIYYGDKHYVTFGIENSGQWVKRNFPKPHKDLDGVLGTQFTVNGDQNRVDVTINGVRDGDDQEDYNFDLTSLIGDSTRKVYEFIVLRPPEPPKLETLRDHAIEGETTDISKCIARGAKPQAEIRYTLVEGGDNALIQELEKLTGTEEAMLSIKPTRYYNDAVIRCEVVHETIMQDDDYQNVWTKTISLDVRYTPGPPKITIDEPVCDDEQMKDMFSFTCADEGLKANPPVSSIQWRLPNGESRTGERVFVPSSMLAQTREITCTTENEIGLGQPTTKSVDLLNQEACPANASAGILILIILIVIFLVCLGVGALYIYKKKLLCFSDAEKGNGDGPANFTDYDISHDKHFTTYSHNNTLQHNTSQYDYQPDEGRPEPPKTRPPNDDDDSDDDGPLLKSPVNSQYHQNRRNESALRHSPSRGASPPKPSDDNVSYSTDYNPVSERGTMQYASLNKEKLGVRQSNSPIGAKNDPIVYADLNRSHTQQDAYV